MKFRTEKDALGKKKVPSDVFYGIHTQRAKENFQISGRSLPVELFHAIVEIKIAAAMANTDLRLLDDKKGKNIIKASRDILRGDYDNDFVVDIFQAGAGTPTHMNVNEVIANVALWNTNGRKGDYKKIHPNDDVNMGQSTNNVIPTALRMVSVSKLKALLINLDYLRNDLSKKSREFKKTLKSGRTHLQDAVPISLGQEFKAYSVSIEKNIIRLKNSLDSLYVLNIGKNAIGTGVNTNTRFTKLILKHLRKINKEKWNESNNPVYSTQSLTDFLEVSQNLKLLAIDLNKICNDLKLLSSGPNTGLYEIKLPAVEPGSSIMPGKVNPSMAEMLNMVCFQVIGNDESISLAADSGQLELNVFIPVIAKNLIESLDILTNGVNAFDRKCIKGIKANDLHIYHP